MSITKKLAASLLAFTFVFGGTALPGAVVGSGTVISAGANTIETLECDDFLYTLSDDDTVEIIKYKGSDTNIRIPSEIDGKAVTSVGSGEISVFYNVKSVVIPNGVKTIGTAAFGGCSNLVDVVIPNSVVTIGNAIQNAVTVTIK
jgi:hypothetical protein